MSKKEVLQRGSDVNAKMTPMRDELEYVRRLNKELEVIFESSYDGLILSDENGRIFKANKSMERVSGGIKVSEIIGKTAKELEEEGIVVSQSKKVLGKNPYIIRQNIKTGVELLVTSTKAYDDDGNFMFYVANIRDITELNRLKQEMEETRGLKDRYLQELKQLREQMLLSDHFVFKSEKMKKVYERVLKVAKTDTNVLLTGPSGAGKEVVAKTIHKTSKRNGGPFIQINCGAIPETLLESELFGYDRGAFTGASRQGKLGLLEMANNGTVLLDEIGDLPLSLQVKLLRVIQEQLIYRVGSTTPVKLNVRIIAATNKDLETMIRQGTFREDLYYRLNVIPIRIPPLSERKEDILPLALHFLERYNKKHGSQKILSPEVCNLLETYDWPGNVRELENLIERMVVIADEKTLTTGHLPGHIKKIAGNKTESFSVSMPLHVRTLKDARETAERNVIVQALQQCGSARKAAEVLGVNHSTIIRKMQQYNISAEEYCKNAPLK